jgi:hypothetical protein
MLESRVVSNHEQEQKMVQIKGNIWYSSDYIAIFNMAKKGSQNRKKHSSMHTPFIVI